MMMYNRLAYELCEKQVLHVVLEIMLRCGGVNGDFRNGLVKSAFEIFWSAIEGVGVEALSGIVTQGYIFAIRDMLTKVIK